MPVGGIVAHTDMDGTNTQEVISNQTISAKTVLQPSQPVVGHPVVPLQTLEGNKHDLHLQNFASVNADRLPGLTPPIYTPGGRRLPPIHLLPGATLGSPGTPGNLWSSLLSATNQPENGQAQANYAQFANMMRKLGLTPNELNLRTGLTPSGLNHAGFNFSPSGATPGLGQMTPGLSSLLGLQHTAHELPPDHVKQEEDEIEEEKPKPKRSRKTKEDRIKKAREDPEAEKRRQFLERNRVAALKCRQRKKQLFRKMEDELAFYSSGYRELLAQVTLLHDQLLQLRNIVLGHKDCPVLVDAVGGFQHLQNLIGQTDFVAQLAANSQPNYTSMPSTIPTTLNAPPPAPKRVVYDMDMNEDIPRNYPQDPNMDMNNNLLRPVDGQSIQSKGNFAVSSASGMPDLQNN